MATKAIFFLFFNLANLSNTKALQQDFFDDVEPVFQGRNPYIRQLKSKVIQLTSNRAFFHQCP